MNWGNTDGSIYTTSFNYTQFILSDVRNESTVVCSHILYNSMLDELWVFFGDTYVVACDRIIWFMFSINSISISGGGGGTSLNFGSDWDPKIWSKRSNS